MIWGPTAAALSNFQFVFDGFNSHIIGPFVKKISVCGYEDKSGRGWEYGFLSQRNPDRLILMAS